MRESDLFDLADEAGGLYLSGLECLEVVKLHSQAEQDRKAAQAELEAIKDKLGEISGLAFDNGRLNRKLLCSLVDELESLLEKFSLPSVAECHEYIQDTADREELFQSNVEYKYNNHFKQALEG